MVCLCVTQPVSHSLSWSVFCKFGEYPWVWLGFNKYNAISSNHMLATQICKSAPSCWATMTRDTCMEQFISFDRPICNGSLGVPGKKARVAFVECLILENHCNHYNKAMTFFSSSESVLLCDWSSSYLEMIPQTDLLCDKSSPYKVIIPNNELLCDWSSPYLIIITQINQFCDWSSPLKLTYSVIGLAHIW